MHLKSFNKTNENILRMCNHFLEVPQCVYPSSHLFFYGEIRNFTVVPKQPFVLFTTKYKILKTAPKRTFVFFCNEIENFESCTQTAIRISHKEIRNLTFIINLDLFLKIGKKYDFEYFVSFFTMKNEIRDIIELWNTRYWHKGL